MCDITSSQHNIQTLKTLGYHHTYTQSSLSPSSLQSGFDAGYKLGLSEGLNVGGVLGYSCFDDVLRGVGERGDVRKIVREGLQGLVANIGGTGRKTTEVTTDLKEDDDDGGEDDGWLNDDDDFDSSNNQPKEEEQFVLAESRSMATCVEMIPKIIKDGEDCGVVLAANVLS